MKEIFLIILVFYAGLVFLQLSLKFFQDNFLETIYGILGVFLLKNIPTVILYLGYKDAAKKAKDISDAINKSKLLEQN
jgi:hypothetical protein